MVISNLLVYLNRHDIMLCYVRRLWRLIITTWKSTSYKRCLHRRPSYNIMLNFHNPEKRWSDILLYWYYDLLILCYIVTDLLILQILTFIIIFLIIFLNYCEAHDKTYCGIYGCEIFITHDSCEIFGLECSEYLECPRCSRT